MTTLSAARSDIRDVRSVVPALPARFTARLHHTRWSESSFSFTHSTPMCLREATPSEAHAVHSALTEAGGHTAHARILVFDHVGTSDEALAPVTAYWCLGDHDELHAALVSVDLVDEPRQLCLVEPTRLSDGTLTGRITVHAGDETVTGRVHLTLTATRVAIGVQIPVEGTPLLTASVTGEIDAARTSGQEPKNPFGSLRVLRGSRPSAARR